MQSLEAEYRAGVFLRSARARGPIPGEDRPGAHAVQGHRSMQKVRLVPVPGSSASPFVRFGLELSDST